MTGLVHWFLLRPLLHLEGAGPVADKLLHLAVPLLAVLDRLVVGPRPRDAVGVPACHRLAAAWLVVSLAQGALTG